MSELTLTLMLQIGKLPDGKDSRNNGRVVPRLREKSIGHKYCDQNVLLCP